MEQIALLLAARVGRQTVNRTGLKGEFDLDLRWEPTPAAGDGFSAPAGPSIFTAIEEQLGLKLESARSPVEVLVIDSIQQPAPD
jgi:uncharacterized protein (TIGR03435 family)